MLATIDAKTGVGAPATHLRRGSSTAPSSHGRRGSAPPTTRTGSTRRGSDGQQPVVSYSQASGGTAWVGSGSVRSEVGAGGVSSGEGGGVELAVMSSAELLTGTKDRYGRKLSAGYI